MTKLGVQNPYRPLGKQAVGHGACLEHVTIEGLEHAVCVLRGQDRERVIAEAIELAGLDVTPPASIGPWLKPKRGVRP